MATSTHYIQGGSDTKKFYLCQLGSVQAEPDVCYPWVNQRDTLGLEFNNNGIYGNENSAVFCDMGSIYLFVDEEGNVEHYFECY